MNWGVRGEGFNLFLPKRKKLCVLFIKKKKNMDQKKKKKPQKRSFPYKLYYNAICVIVVFCEFCVNIGC